MTYEQPPGAAALCTRCGIRLIACYPDQQLHPNCDPDAPGLTDEQITYWAARYHANNRQDQP
ncbi:hypothetical protein [Pseudonocardia parietis]|uniref:Uncharacterized protein n=1 Tax=Pseudonocardia parietis TaxID=570936 RepID=A0ABS4W245_9PSEU|nr:hypothetical protein [Pseudonocardia parietis]MBP2370276.1 hypothetical protein [Pseudonocardia parietis]